MSDPKDAAASRLGDLPDAGYSTYRQRQTSDLVMFWLREVERDRFLLLSIVCGGWDKWRKIAGKAWDINRAGRSTAMGTELLKLVWEYMGKLAGSNPQMQLEILKDMKRSEVLKWDFRKATAISLMKARIDAQLDLEKEQRKPRKFYIS